MSQALHIDILLINLMNELISTLDISYIKLILKYKVYEDNQSTIAIAKVLSILP